jgi:hypothetical protein
MVDFYLNVLSTCIVVVLAIAAMIGQHYRRKLEDAELRKRWPACTDQGETK